MEVTLRRLDLSDADELMEWFSDEKVCRLCTWEPLEHKSDAIEFIEQFVGPHPWFRAICVDGRPVGAISVTKNAGEAAQCEGPNSGICSCEGPNSGFCSV